MQTLGQSASYVKITGTGKNALDFHIACHLGELVAKAPKSTIYVISKDKGFDPLIQHLKARGVTVSRRVDVAEIPELRIPVSRGKDEQVEAVIENLHARGKSRPRKLSTLQNTINHLLDKKLAGSEMDAFIGKLMKRKVVAVDGTKVTYNFKRLRTPGPA
jgi:DNA-binding protein